MHRAFSSVSAAIGVTLEANVRNPPTLLTRKNGLFRPAERTAQSWCRAAATSGWRPAASSVMLRILPIQERWWPFQMQTARRPLPESGSLCFDVSVDSLIARGRLD